MTRQILALAPLLALGMSISACSSGSEPPDASASASASNTTFVEDAVPKSAPAVSPAPSEPAPAVASSDKVLTLEGLGDLKIGQAVPAGGSWAERGAQANDACRTITSPDHPGVYAIVTGGKVRRVTVGQRSDAKLIEGIGIGSTEGDVGKWFAGFRAEPHTYLDAPAKYLTAPNASSGGPALRFEIGTDRKVSLMHVGTMPELDFVEGCN